MALLSCLALAGCASRPLLPYSTDTPPLMLVPALQQPEQDARGRFREIFCAVLEARQDNLPDYRPCADALTTVGDEAPGDGRPVHLGLATRPLKALFVPGLGWECFSQWLHSTHPVRQHLRPFGYDMLTIDIAGLDSSAHNAARIRNAVLAAPASAADSARDIVLIGYSKGIVGALTAISQYPEIRDRIAAVVSLAGAVGGSPLAYEYSDAQIKLLRLFPGAACVPDNDRPLRDLQLPQRMTWLADHSLPASIRYYSIATFPHPARISRLLRSGHEELAQVDPRNDGQLIFYNQFIPGSRLVAYLNADHWAAAVPVARTHPAIGAVLLDQNAYPREALFEALLRLIDEDLAAQH